MWLPNSILRLNERWNCVGFRKNACMHVGCCNIGLQWSINEVLIETFPLVVGSRAEGGVASKLGNETRLMTMTGGTVLDSVKMLACMLGGCNIGLQWSINGVLIETFPLVVGSRAEWGMAFKPGNETRLMTMKGGTVLDSEKMLACMLGGCNIGLQWSINGVLIETFPLVVGSKAEGGVASKHGNETRLITMKGGTVLDTVKMLACMLGGCDIGLQWSINGVLIDLVVGSRAEGGVASKLGNETRLMTMKGGTVFDSVKMLACMLGGCNIGLQWSINGVLIETFPFVVGSRAEGDVASNIGNETRLMTMKGETVLNSVKMLSCMLGGCNIGLQWSINGVLIDLVVGSRAEGGVASKLGNETRLMTMKGGTVFDSVKMLACMLGGCNIGLQWSINGVLIETFPLVVRSRSEGDVAFKLGYEKQLITMKGGTVLDSVKMLACMLGGCNIGLQWSINGVLMETFPLVVGSRAEGGVASKLGNETRLMTMKGGTVLDSVKMLACMLGGCNIGLQWSINGVLMETFPLVVGSRAKGGVASKLRNETWLMTMKGGTVLDSVKMLACMLGGCNIGLQWNINGV